MCKYFVVVEIIFTITQLPIFNMAEMTCSGFKELMGFVQTYIQKFIFDRHSSPLHFHFKSESVVCGQCKKSAGKHVKRNTKKGERTDANQKVGGKAELQIARDRNGAK